MRREKTRIVALCRCWKSAVARRFVRPALASATPQFHGKGNQIGERFNGFEDPSHKLQSLDAQALGQRCAGGNRCL